MNLRHVIKLYEKCERAVCDKYGLTQTEVDVIAFLFNNPGRDTASEIVEIRMLPKANISQAVESLICKKLLLRSRDTRDRRRIHLTLTEKAVNIIPDIQKARQCFYDVLFREFTNSERQLYVKMSRRISKNAVEGLTGGNGEYDGRK
jgi:DNA-binding MarR family transcriptional regulator